MYPIVFDNDCLSSFSWVNRVDILTTLYPGDKIIPQQVIDELKVLKNSSKFSYVFNNVTDEISKQNFRIVDFSITSNEAKKYNELINKPLRLGLGEAAAIAIVTFNGGTVASNNISEIQEYIDDHSLKNIRTDNILYDYYVNNERRQEIAVECNDIWNQMKQKKRKLPNCDFYGVIKKFDSVMDKQ